MLIADAEAAPQLALVINDEQAPAPFMDRQQAPSKLSKLASAFLHLVADTAVGAAANPSITMNTNLLNIVYLYLRGIPFADAYLSTTAYSVTQAALFGSVQGLSKNLGSLFFYILENFMQVLDDDRRLAPASKKIWILIFVETVTFLLMFGEFVDALAYEQPYIDNYPQWLSILTQLSYLIGPFTVPFVLLGLEVLLNKLENFLKNLDCRAAIDQAANSPCLVSIKSWCGLHAQPANRDPDYEPIPDPEEMQAAVDYSA